MRIAIGQAGAPSTVVDQTVLGIVEGLSGHEVLAVRGGPDGLVNGVLDVVTLEDLPGPGPRGGSWLGAGRRSMTPEDVGRSVEVLVDHGVDALALIGGNGTMALLDAVANSAARLAPGLRVVGVPKTIDNDVLYTDHAPGFASAARYLTSVVPDLARDQHAMQGVEPIRVVETLGRAVGWLALAATWHRDDPEHAPDIVLLPELQLDEEAVVRRVDEVLTRRGRAFLVVSEGVRLGDECERFDAMNHTTLLHGGVARRLAAALSSVLGIQARGEVLGMVQRSASRLASVVDVREAFDIGLSAAGLLTGRPSGALDISNGTEAVMVTIVREPSEVYAVRHATVPLAAVAGRTREVPDEWRTDDPAALDDFYRWLAPLLT
jgi:ATP-dependent phosphofructokinase / diphosphate-dependent phosphofructokinase